MSVSSTRARHRAARRPITPLTDLAQAAGSLAVAGRRTAVAAASAGLLVSTFAAPAGAANPSAPAASASVPAVTTSSLNAQARAALAAAPAVTVAPDAVFALRVPAVTVVKDPPPPPPAPEPEVQQASRTTAAASRSTARAAVPAARAAQAAPATQAAAAVEVEEAPVEAAPAAAAPASASGGSIADIARQYVGVPYLSGGTTPSGFDCSGFTSYVYAQVGIDLPRTSGAQRSAGTVVSSADAQPGDLIWTPGHISIYLGGGMQADAPRPGKTIQVRTIWQSNPTYLRF